MRVVIYARYSSECQTASKYSMPIYSPGQWHGARIRGPAFASARGSPSSAGGGAFAGSPGGASSAPCPAKALPGQGEDLVSALDGDDAATARELVCSPVEHITLHPEANGCRVEVRGELAATLALRGTGVSSYSASASLSGDTNNEGPGRNAGALAFRVVLVAGTGFEPVTFRL